MHQPTHDFGCDCPHYRSATKALHHMELLPMPGCPPEYKQHCCEELGRPCLGAYAAFKSRTEDPKAWEKKEATLAGSFVGGKTGLRLSGSIRPPSPWSEQQMIAECHSCHKVLGCREMDKHANRFPTDDDDDKFHWYCSPCTKALTCCRCGLFGYASRYTVRERPLPGETSSRRMCWLCHTRFQDPQCEIEKCARCLLFLPTYELVSVLGNDEDETVPHLIHRASICRPCCTLETGMDAEGIRTIRLDHLEVPFYEEYELVLCGMKPTELIIDETTDDSTDEDMEDSSSSSSDSSDGEVLPPLFPQDAPDPDYETILAKVREGMDALTTIDRQLSDLWEEVNNPLYGWDPVAKK